MIASHAVPPIRKWARQVALPLSFVIAAACGGGNAPGVRAPIGPPADGPVAIDLADRLPAARVLIETTSLDLRNPGDAGRLVTGWGRIEDHLESGTTFVWANAESSELVLDLVSASARRLVMRGWPYRYPDAPTQTVTAVVNGTTIGTSELGRILRRVEFDIPEGVLLPGRNRIRFNYGYAASPRDHQEGSKDRRRLAVAMEEVSLEPSSPPRDASRTSVMIEPGPAIRQSAGTAVVFDLVGPVDGVLDLGVAFQDGFDGAAEAWLRPQDGPPRRLVRFEGDGEAPGRRTVDLADVAERRFDLVLSAAGESGSVVWRQPVIRGGAAAVRRPANVVLIVVDTLRADTLGVYGGAANTPAIDRLAAEGVVFDHAYSHIPITGPSHSSMFTSLNVFEHGVFNNARVLDSEFDTLTEVMRASGRHTAGFVSLGVLHHDYGFDQGFERYADAFQRDWMKSGDEVLREVFEWLDGSFVDPFFLWVHFADPHEPYAPPGLDYPEIRVLHDGLEVGRVRADGRGGKVAFKLPAGDSTLRLELAQPGVGRTFRVPTARLLGGKYHLEPASGWVTSQSSERSHSGMLETGFPAEWKVRNAGSGGRGVLILHCTEVLSLDESRARYRLEVEAADTAVGHLLERLRRQGLLDNAVVALVSDHGEGMGDHGLVGHIDQLYNSLVHVPMILWSPNRVPAGRRISEPVSLVDLAPTLAGLAGVEAPEGSRGLSLTRTWEGGLEPRSFVLETHRPEAIEDLQALVWHGYKLIRQTSGGRVELYDLAADPKELQNLATDRPDVVAELMSELDRRLSGGSRAATEVELTEEERGRLRALGYIH